MRSGSLVDGVLERHGRLDLLVNNAGGQFLAPAETISAKGFRTVTELNVQGTWNMTHAAATKAFIPQRGGKVVSVTLSPHNGMPGMVHSGAARAAVENMMRTLSVEWSRYGIRLCAVAPGQFDTEVFRTKYPAQVVETVPRTIPLGRLGRPEEMAWLIAYLASPAGRLLQRHGADHRRCPRQLVRRLAAAVPDRRGRRATGRGAALAVARRPPRDRSEPIARTDRRTSGSRSRSPERSREGIRGRSMNFRRTRPAPCGCGGAETGGIH